MSSTGSTRATDMFAFGHTIFKVASACDLEHVTSSAPAAKIVASLTSTEAADRLTAEQTVQHAFFDAARDSCANQIAGWSKCHLRLGDKCPDGHTKLSMGMACTKEHFVCLSCFENVMHDACEPGSAMGMRARMSDGRIHCPDCLENGDMNAYTDSQLLKIFPTQMCDQYLRTRIEFVQNRQCGELEREMREKIQVELSKLQSMHELQVKVLAAQKHIEEEFLQMKCPSCNAAIHNFNGYAAVQCFK
jgi:hypothetical protein